MTLHSRASARSRNKKSACRSYRKVLWFRPRLEHLEDRTLLAAPSDVLSAFNNNNAVGTLNSQAQTYFINDALQNLDLPPLVNQMLASAFGGFASNWQQPFASLPTSSWQDVVNRLQLNNPQSPWQLDEPPQVTNAGTSSETWSPNGDGDYFELTLLC